MKQDMEFSWEIKDAVTKLTFARGKILDDFALAYLATFSKNIPVSELMLYESSLQYG
jgi:hypothetical protein